MITANENIISMLTSPVRKIEAKVEFFEGSTLVETCHCNDRIIKFTVERIGDTSKFFGFGICQKMNIHLIDKNRELSFSTANSIKISYGVNGETIYPYPTFHISEVRRDENTNELSITAYDLMYPDTAHVIADMNLPEEYNLLYFASVASATLKAKGLTFKNIPDSSDFLLNLPKGGNFEGHETVRQGLNGLAEATQTVYYINHDDQLVFTRLNKDAAPDLSITKSDYITLKSRTNRRLGTIYHATELTDDLSASTAAAGTTQFIRENPFWTLLESTEILALLERGIELVGGLTINQFECSWRGNFLLEIGDKIALTAKDDEVMTSYVLDDTFTYDGSFSENTQWSYIDNNNETPETPNSLGEALNQTFARVDKIRREIELVAKQTEEMPNQIASLKVQVDEIKAQVEELDMSENGAIKEEIAALKLRADEIELKVQSLEENNETINSEMASIKVANDSITATVEQVESNVNANLDSVNSSIDTITQKLTTTVTTESVSILVQNEMAKGGVTSVETETGFTFNSDGMAIEKAGSEMKTMITEDGMAVYRSDVEVLTADNTGVYAENLHATTFLMMGKYSRFEDYTADDGEPRTGCFWMIPTKEA